MTSGPRRAAAAGVAAAILAAAAAAAAPYPATSNDFVLPGTPPLALVDPIATPAACRNCHAGFGEPAVEPVRNWQGSMMAQAGRDPLMYAALAIANQDVQHAGETCLRCHLPKGWLEGRSVPEDGSSMTAEDREGVQCGVCHRMVDPVARPENPPEDQAILGALAAPVTNVGSAQFVIDPEDRLRGPFDVVADLGSDPHAPARSTLVSPFHRSAELCGTCHDVSNPLFTRDATGRYVPNPLDQPADPALGFPEQRTYSEWLYSDYARGGVVAPQFGRNREMVSTCQDCHMPAVSGHDAKLAPRRDDLPLHEMAGANTFVPRILPAHPIFGAEVDADILAETVTRATTMLRKAATVEVTLAGGALTVRVVNETGHKLPTGYPEGRRMWLHVRAFDGRRRVVLESGRYVFETAQLVADPHLKVWETVQGLTPEWAAAVGRSPGPSFHLVLNNVVLHDNRIPPRGFTNAAYAAFGGAPIGAAYADGQHWDDTVYPVGPEATAAEVVLWYQTASKEYVEFLHDENVTNAAGPILFDLWERGGRSEPVAMARVWFDARRVRVGRCRQGVERAQKRYWKTYLREWGRCFATEAAGLTCDAAARDARIAAASARLADAIGGLADARCAAESYTPQTIGHGPVCPAPCGADITLLDLGDLAACAVCQAESLAGAALAGAYGATPPAIPDVRPRGDALRCQARVARAAERLAADAAAALVRCRRTGGADCSGADDAGGRLTRARARALRTIAGCRDFGRLGGCGTHGEAEATAACLGDAIRPAAAGFAEVAYP
jgi:hypothetical protein